MTGRSGRRKKNKAERLMLHAIRLADGEGPLGLEGAFNLFSRSAKGAYGGRLGDIKA